MRRWLWAFAEGFGLTTIEAAAMETTVRAWALLKAFDLVRWAMDRCPCALMTRVHVPES